MNSGREFDLLCDLSKLIKKYGAQTFDELARELASPDFMERFLDVLRLTANAHRRTPSIKKRATSSKESDFRALLVNTGRTEAEKSRLLTDLYDALKSKAVLPTLREMQSFASDNGLPPITHKSREKALVPFVKTFLRMPIEDVRFYLSQIRQTGAPDDRSLEGWSNIIFGNKNGGTQESAGSGLALSKTWVDSDFERMAKHITNYLTAKRFSRVGFERIRKSINSDYSDELLFEMIDRFPERFRRVTLRGNKPAVGLVSDK
jgi:hypothetical protein